MSNTAINALVKLLDLGIRMSANTEEADTYRKYRTHLRREIVEKAKNLNKPELGVQYENTRPERISEPKESNQPSDRLRSD